jgi:hypothetical protein
MAERGRPKTERRTRGVKVYDDTGEKLAWVLKIEGNKQSAAEFIDPLIRAEVERRYALVAKRVEAIKRALAQPEVARRD